MGGERRRAIEERACTNLHSEGVISQFPKRKRTGASRCPYGNCLFEADWYWHKTKKAREKQTLTGFLSIEGFTNSESASSPEAQLPFCHPALLAE